jgi:15-cis-phytoene synthase
MADGATLGSALSSLQQLDRAQYLSGLFVPEAKREAFAALAAYAAELRQIPFIVSDPLPGEIRLQWWRDVVSGERSLEAASHPVVPALLAAIQTYSLPLGPLIAMADARLFDLYQDPMPDVAALETYLGETEAAKIQLSGLILDPANAANAAGAAGHAGMAIGIAKLVGQLRRTTGRQQCYIPADILSATGCTAEMIIAGDTDAQLKALTAIISLGRDHLKTIKSLGQMITPALRPAFLGAALCEPVFRKAEKLGAQAFATDITVAPLVAPVRLAYRAMRGW